MYELRPYHEEARQAVLSEWEPGSKRTLLVMATGTGKTVVIAKVVEAQIKGRGHRALVLTHRSVLLIQASSKIFAATGLYSALEKADCTSLGSMCPITVGSVQSLAQPKRLARFHEDCFTDIVVDEAHRCMSDSCQKILNHFPNANVLGVTATPDRGDMKSLGEFFDSKAYEYTMMQAIREGYLCPIKAQMIPLKLDINSVGLSSWLRYRRCLAKRGRQMVTEQRCVRPYGRRTH